MNGYWEEARLLVNCNVEFMRHELMRTRVRRVTMLVSKLVEK